MVEQCYRNREAEENSEVSKRLARVHEVHIIGTLFTVSMTLRKSYS